MSSAPYARKLLTSERIHIFGISGHWLNSSNIHFLQSIHKGYQSYGVIDRDNYLPGRRPIGKGGVALMWHKSLNNNITTLDIDSDRMCGSVGETTNIWPFLKYNVLRGPKGAE